MLDVRVQQRPAYLSFLSAHCECDHSNQDDVSRPSSVLAILLILSRLVLEALPIPAQDPHVCVQVRL